MSTDFVNRLTARYADSRQREPPTDSVALATFTSNPFGRTLQQQIATASHCLPTLAANYAKLTPKRLSERVGPFVPVRGTFTANQANLAVWRQADASGALIPPDQDCVLYAVLNCIAFPRDDAAAADAIASIIAEYLAIAGESRTLTPSQVDRFVRGRIPVYLSLLDAVQSDHNSSIVIFPIEECGTSHAVTYHKRLLSRSLIPWEEFEGVTGNAPNILLQEANLRTELASEPSVAKRIRDIERFNAKHARTSKLVARTKPMALYREERAKHLKRYK
jgi:hypothetical protein